MTSTVPVPVTVILPLSELLPDVQDAFVLARRPGGWDNESVQATVHRLFDWLGPYTSGQITIVDGQPLLTLTFTTPAGRDPVAGETRFRAASTKADRGNVGGALREFRELVQEFPEVAKYHRALGQAHLVGGQPEQAEDAFLHSLALDPRDRDTLTLLGNLYV